MTHSDSLAFGAVYPLSKNLISRILDDKRLVFAKFLAHRSPETNLGTGSLILFYETGGIKSIVGEAMINRVEFIKPYEIEFTGSRRFFLEREEFASYVNKFPGREKKAMLVAYLESLKRYEVPRKWPYPMTMAGQYITRDEYLEIIGGDCVRQC